MLKSDLERDDEDCDENQNKDDEIPPDSESNMFFDCMHYEYEVFINQKYLFALNLLSS